MEVNLEPGCIQSHARPLSHARLPAATHRGKKGRPLGPLASSTLRTQPFGSKLIFPQAGPRAHVLALAPTGGFSNLTPPAFRVRVCELLCEIVRNCAECVGGSGCRKGEMLMKSLVPPPTRPSSETRGLQGPSVQHRHDTIFLLKEPPKQKRCKQGSSEFAPHFNLKWCARVFGPDRLPEA